MQLFFYFVLVHWFDRFIENLLEHCKSSIVFTFIHLFFACHFCICVVCSNSLAVFSPFPKVARKRIRRKPGNKVTMVTMQSASNASNVNVETKVLKDKAMGVSKTSRKLAKYSAAKYLQKQGARLNSDMMSLETDCLHNSADSFASTESPNGSANRHANSPFGRHQDDGSHSTTLHSKKLSISSIARTTTTSISMANPSDLSTCSSFGMSPNGQTSSNRLLLCSKVESSIGGYSIITEEGSSSSSSAQPPLTSLHVLENVPEPEVNEHSPLPLPSLAFAHHSNGTIWTEPVDYSICPCDRADCINSICINESTRKHKKRFSMVVSKENGYGVLCPPPRTKSMSMCSNDANQNALCDGEQVGALASRYRAQSNDSIAKKAPSYGALGHCALSCDESASPVAATVVVAFSANDALYCKPMNDQLASDSHLIAIDTNYGHQFGENKHSTEMEGTTEKRNDSLGDTSQPLTSNDPDRQSRGQMTPSCNHAANGGLGNHMGTTSQPCSPSPPTDEQPCNKPAKGVSLKEDSTSSSFGSAAANPPSPKCNHKQHKKHKCPLKQSSQHSNPSPSPHQSRLYQKESIESKRERKAAKTLAIITGTCYHFIPLNVPTLGLFNVCISGLQFKLYCNKKKKVQNLLPSYERSVCK